MKCQKNKQQKKILQQVIDKHNQTIARLTESRKHNLSQSSKITTLQSTIYSAQAKEYKYLATINRLKTERQNMLRVQNQYLASVASKDKQIVDLFNAYQVAQQSQNPFEKTQSQSVNTESPESPSSQ